MAINFSTSGLETQKYASNIARIYHFEDATHNIGISDSAASIIIELILQRHLQIQIYYYGDFHQ